MLKKARISMIVLSALVTFSCGIKGDPLPPETTSSEKPTPKPTPTAAASKSVKSKKGR